MYSEWFELPTKETWEPLTDVQRLNWAIRLLQQEVRNHFANSPDEMPTKVAEAMSVAELAANES